MLTPLPTQPDCYEFGYLKLIEQAVEYGDRTTLAHNPNSRFAALLKASALLPLE